MTNPHLCPLHGAIVTNREHGQVFCLGCFHDARIVATAVGVDELVRRLAQLPKGKP